MLLFLTTFLVVLPSILRSRAAVELENLALRHQIGVLQRSAAKRPKINRRRPPVLDLSLSALARLALGAGHRQAWNRRSLASRCVSSVPGPGKCGAAYLDRKMCRENPTWGAPRIHGELLKLGINIAESSVSKYMVLRTKPPSQSWRTFLENHVQQLVSIDFFTVPTIHFQVL